MIGTLYNQSGQLNIKVLLVCPYDLDHHGGVQNQVKLLKMDSLIKVSIQKYLDHHLMITTSGILSRFRLMVHRTQ